jgi:hypothetical protein
VLPHAAAADAAHVNRVGGHQPSSGSGLPNVQVPGVASMVGITGRCSSRVGSPRARFRFGNKKWAVCGGVTVRLAARS